MNVVNIVLIAHNRAALTRQAIATLLQHTPKDQFTLTIVDDGSNKETERAIEAIVESETHYLNGPKIWLEQNVQPKGVGGARNQGAEASRQRFGQGEYLYFSDNDVAFTSDWLARLTDAFESGQALNFALVGGYAHPYNQTIKEWPGARIHEKHAVDGLSWLLTWDTWGQFGKFCDNVTDRRSSEDHEYCQRIRKAGYRVGVVDPPVIINCGRTDSWGNEIPGADVAIKNVEGLVVQ